MARKFLLLFLIVYITATPVVTTIFHQFDLKYELCEMYGEEDPKEKEMLVDDSEDKRQELYATQNRSSIYFNRLLAAFNPDIQLPPPKKS